MSKTNRSSVAHAALNISVLAALWAATFAAVQLTEGRGQVLGLTVVLVTAAVLAVSLKLQTRVATYITGVVLAFHLATFGARAFFGTGTVQGLGNHLAVMAAALLAVTVTLLLQRSILRRRVVG